MLIYPQSQVEYNGTAYYLARSQGQKYLGVRGDRSGFEGGQSGPQQQALFPLSPANAAVLRSRLPWLNAQPLGLRTSAGCGDRLGLATPGHIRAATGRPLGFIFAQQSVRENARSKRNPQQVINDALWGLFQEGWRLPWGADADHLKQPEDIPAFIQAGYSFFTVDPGEHVSRVAHGESLTGLRQAAAALDWSGLATTLADMRTVYLGRSFQVGAGLLEYNERDLLQTMVKYGGAVANAAQMYRSVRTLKGSEIFDFEVSVDETDEPTTPLEHFWIASELRRLGVDWVSLAPRFVGAFEKGVDYIGDLAYFESELAKHAAIQQHFGNYKISLHSGSDKFRIYGLAAKYCQGKVHLKTAGTSYLEGLRVMAARRPLLFRQILELGRERYPQDRASYHVSGDLAKVPASAGLADADLPGLIDQPDARQMLHVCFGSALDVYGAALKTALMEEEEAYYAALEHHFSRHFEPFCVTTG